jgi:hypothetical protein
MEQAQAIRAWNRTLTAHSVCGSVTLSTTVFIGLILLS